MLADLYPWVKAFHIISVIAWMAGLFYLPRLYVYHSEKVGLEGDTAKLFQTMEFKLLKVIMNPAMVSTWFFGVLLAVTPGVVDWSAFWPWIKLSAIFGMTWFHMWCATQRKMFALSGNVHSGKRYRAMNEVPTVLLVVIVLSVVVRPF